MPHLARPGIPAWCQTIAIASTLVAFLAVGERQARGDDLIPGELHLGSPSLGVTLVYGGVAAIGATSLVYTGLHALARTRAWTPARWTSAVFGAAILAAGVYAAVRPDPGDTSLFGVVVAVGGGLSISGAIFSGGRHGTQVVVSAARATALIGLRLPF